MKKFKRSVSPKIGERSARWYEKNFKTLNMGCTVTVESFPHLYECTIKELEGRFTLTELEMMLSVSKRHPPSVNRVLQIYVEDSFNLNECAGIDKSDLLSKLKDCSQFEMYCLQVLFSNYKGSDPKNFLMPLLFSTTDAVSRVHKK